MRVEQIETCQQRCHRNICHKTPYARMCCEDFFFFKLQVLFVGWFDDLSEDLIDDLFDGMIAGRL